MRIKFLGGVQEVGKSAILVETDIKTLMEYGLKIRQTEESSRYPEPFGGHLDILAVGHCHIDHSGFLPAVFDICSPTVLGTAPTKELIGLLLEDSMKLMEEIPYRLTSYKQLMKNFIPTEYDKSYFLGKTAIKLLDAGHITGSSMIEIRHEKKRLLYTSDFNTTDTMLHTGTVAPKNDYSALILETTYADRDHPDRKQTEQKFYNRIKEVYEDNGHILVPAFAVDRAQEIINVIRKFDKHIPISLDGMCNDATDIMFKYKNFLRDPKQFRKSMDSIERVYGFRQRKRVLDEPGVVVTTAGMLTGGPAMYYIPNLNKNSAILFTGYCVEGTNGNTLQTKGTMMIDKKEVNINTPWEYFDFSAHAGRKELIQFVKDTNPEKIFCVHGEKCNEFAEELEKEYGFKSVAPKLNEEFRL